MSGMSTVLEIEQAIHQLPAEDKWKLLSRLQSAMSVDRDYEPEDKDPTHAAAAIASSSGSP